MRPGESMATARCIARSVTPFPFAGSNDHANPDGPKRTRVAAKQHGESLDVF
jgi:hypothetical protein